MKCPICQAKLLPVDGELFCLQCGNVVDPPPGTVNETPSLEETTDPLLQRAIVDAVHHEVHFRLPVAAAQPTASVASFSSMRSVLASPRAAVAGGAVALPAPGRTEGVAGASGAAGAAAVQQSAAEAVAAAKPAPDPAQVAPKAVVPVTVASAPAVSAVTAAGPVGAGVVPSAGAQAPTGVKIGATDQNVLPARPERPVAVLRVGSSLAAWAIGLVVFVLFVGVNVALQWYYSARVYPGVRVGSMAVGGMPLSDLRQKLATVVPNAGLAVQIGGVKYAVNAQDLGGPDVDRLEREVREVGRTTPLPMAGAIRSLLSAPVAVHYAVNDAGLERIVTDLSSKVERRASDALPLIVGNQAFVIADKQGV
jgi:hypothetical protein